MILRILPLRCELAQGIRFKVRLIIRLKIVSRLLNVDGVGGFLSFLSDGQEDF